MAANVAGTAGSNSGDSTTPGATATLPAGTSGALVKLWREGGTEAPAINSVGTLGGVALGEPVFDDDSIGVTIYLVLNPSSGSQAWVGCELASSAMWDAIIVPFNGHDTVTPLGTIELATGSEVTTPTTVEDDTVTGDLVVGFGFMVSDTIDVQSGQGTLLTRQQAIQTAFRSWAASYAPGAATVNIGYQSASSFGDTWIITVPVLQGAGGSSSALSLILNSAGPFL